MPKKWTIKEEKQKKRELERLYVGENNTINEIANILNIAPQTVFQRLKRFDIPTTPHLKIGYLNKRSDVKIPQGYSPDLAEFFGIMLGDGHINHFQIIVSLGDKDLDYVNYVVDSIENIFSARPKIYIRPKGYRDVYLGSVDITKWLFSEGLVQNKVESQVDVPKWIFSTEEYMKRFLRGFFDTDGSIYKLKYGVQLSFVNESKPLLKSCKLIADKLDFKTSAISGNRFYITKRGHIERFFKKIQPQNSKHIFRYNELISRVV